MTGVVYLNGRLVAATRARISVFDRGFFYGDGLFETVRAYDGRVFALDDHLCRLQASARWLGIAVPEIDWPRAIAALLRRNGLAEGCDAAVRITLTRGPGRLGLLPPPHSAPTVVITCVPIDPGVRRAQRRGVTVALLPFARDSVFAGHKLLDYVPAILGRRIARHQRAFEALYVDTRHRLSEGTTCNLFLCHGGRLLTPAASGARGILPGVTRRLVIDLAEMAALGVRQRRLEVTHLFEADEALCTSSLVEIVPIVRAGDRAIGSGRPGPITRRLQQLYRETVELRLSRSSRPRRDQNPL